MPKAHFLLALIFLAVIFISCTENESVSQFKTHHITQEELGKKFICPICGMEITVSTQTPALEYKGQIYYFCTEDEKAQFMKTPEEFLSKEETISEEEIEAAGYKPHRITPEEIDQIALCPGCRMYLAVSSETLALEKEGKIFYFCSQDCMAEFLRRKR